MTLVKIDDTTIAEVGMEETKRIWGKTELVNRKAQLEADLAKINDLLNELNKV